MEKAILDILKSIQKELKETNHKLQIIENKMGQVSTKFGYIGQNREDARIKLGQVKKSGDFTCDKVIKQELLAIWGRAKDIIREEISEVSFRTWIDNVQPIEIEDNRFYISVVNEFQGGIIKERYAKMLESILKDITSHDYIVEVLVDRGAI